MDPRSVGVSIVTQETRSWWAVVGFCATSALVIAFSFAILLAGATAAFAIGQSMRAGGKDVSSGAKSFAGVVTDSRCGARHQDASKSPSECAQICVRNGSSYVLVDGDKSLMLAGDTAQIAKLAGQRVSVAGSLDGETLKVDSIRPQQ
ncbi:MAG TPA: hypothetical protein VFA68_14730 [Terriglobales bacterium]|nr:hypothetical protein [Terriglobales bacterium]